MRAGWDPPVPPGAIQDLRDPDADWDSPVPPGAISDHEPPPITELDQKNQTMTTIALTVKGKSTDLAAKGMQVGAEMSGKTMDLAAKGMKVGAQGLIRAATGAATGMAAGAHDGVDYSKFFHVDGMDLAERRYIGLESQSVWGCFIPPMQRIKLPKSLRTPVAFIYFMWCGLRYTCFRADHLALQALAVANTAICSYINLRMQVQISVVVFGTIFPLVFIIGANWKRRETAIMMVAAIKATAVTFVMRNRSLSKGLQPGSDLNLRRVVYLTKRILKEIGGLLPHHSTDSVRRISEVYHLFDVLGHISANDVDAPAHVSFMLLRTMVVEFEKMRMLRDYRTPWGLNYFCFIFGLFTPVALGPYFATIGCKEEDGCGWGTIGSMFTAWIFAMVIGCLLSVIKNLEDPFDQQGVDDIVISFDLESDALLRMPPPASFDWAELQVKEGIGFLGSDGLSGCTKSKEQSEKDGGADRDGPDGADDGGGDGGDDGGDA